MPGLLPTQLPPFSQCKVFQESRDTSMRSVQNLLILFIEYPEEENNEPGISAVETYDAMWVAATSHVMNTMFANQCQIYLKNNSFFDFTGISVRVHIIKTKLASSHRFGVVNVIGKSLQRTWYMD